MDFLIGRLVTETFPETAPSVLKLAHEFADDPEIEANGLRNGMFAVAVAVCGTEQIAKYLQNPGLTARDIHQGIQTACNANDIPMVNLLLADARVAAEPFQLRKHAIGALAPDTVQILLSCPVVKIQPHRRDIVFAALAPYDYRMYMDGLSPQRIGNLGTLQLLLNDARFVLPTKFCRIVCQVIERVLNDENWMCVPESIDLPWLYGDDYKSYTDFESLGRILQQDARFAPFAGGFCLTKTKDRL